MLIPMPDMFRKKNAAQNEPGIAIPTNRLFCMPRMLIKTMNTSTTAVTTLLTRFETFLLIQYDLSRV